MEQIYCAMERIIRPKKGFTPSEYAVVVYRAIQRNDKLPESGRFVATGRFLPVFPGTVIVLEGNFINTRNGQSFRVFRSRVKANNSYITFQSLMDKMGVNHILSKRLWDQYGNGIYKVLSQDAEELKKIDGVSERIYESLEKSFFQYTEKGKATAFLTNLGVGMETIQEALNSRPNATKEVFEHPYRLVKSLGFFTCDRISKLLDVDRNSVERLSAELIELIKDCEKKGSTAFSKKTVLEKAKKELKEFNEADINAVFEKMCISGKGYVQVGNLVSRRDCYDAETDVAKRIIALLRARSDVIPDVASKVSVWEEEHGFKLAPEQREAVISSLTHGFSIITGGPGRGKTTIAQCITDIRKKYGEDKSVILMAPTGRASKKLQESTKIPASTIHSALNICDAEKYTQKMAKEHILSAGTIIVDESSMLDIFLARDLLWAVSNGSQLTLVGDIDQLPSVGAGAVLRDCIESGVIPVVRLTTIYRQKGVSKIITNAEKIRLGNDRLEYDGKTFSLYRTEEEIDAARKIISLYQEKVREYGKEEVILLSPRHRNNPKGKPRITTCTDTMNKNLQHFVNRRNAERKIVTKDNREIRLGDLVMQTQNDSNATNGDVGEVLEVGGKNNSSYVKVRFDNHNIVKYVGKDLKKLDLGYALTIHKAQGSEYKCVIMAMLPSHGCMLQRNLLYTGITRAKQECILVASDAAIAQACAFEGSSKRTTLLVAKLRILENA